MATYTSNLNLYMPDSTDDFGEFRAEHNDNMVKIDNAIGGGGGSGGHTIVNENGTDMPAEGKLQFTGGVTVTDDSVNGKTVVDISGGGGNVYGAFIDTNRIITSGVWNGSFSYLAGEDCFVCLEGDLQNSHFTVYIDGVKIYDIGSSTYASQILLFSVRKGQTLTATRTTNYDLSYTVYGLTQGTNGIFTPIIYSDTERVVGVWRDNKPLYQRTWEFGSSVLVSYSSWTNTTVDSSDIENIITVKAKHADGTCFEGIMADPTVSGHTLVGLQTTRNGAEANVKTLTLQYTKISDVAGSGNWNTDGVPTVHYSTSEQVIGTWIDGKPLYGKTVIFGSIPSNSTKEVDHNISDLKMTIGFEGTMMSGTVCETLPSGENSNFRIQTTPTKLKIITGASWSGWDDSYITIKYTKTTD